MVFIRQDHAHPDLDGSKIDDGMVVNRNRENTVLVGDQGGYQIRSGAWKLDWSNFETVQIGKRHTCGIMTWLRRILRLQYDQFDKPMGYLPHIE